MKLEEESEEEKEVSDDNDAPDIEKSVHSDKDEKVKDLFEKFKNLYILKPDNDTLNQNKNFKFYEAQLHSTLDLLFLLTGNVIENVKEYLGPVAYEFLEYIKIKHFKDPLTKEFLLCDGD